MNIPMGTFHGVTGVAVGLECLSILNREGVEQLIPIVPHFNRKTGEFDPIDITGEFGDFTGVTGGAILTGLEPSDITNIEVVTDFIDDDFHTRVLRMRNSKGTYLSWSLYCEGKPS